jgi:hypothetical protein
VTPNQVQETKAASCGFGVNQLENIMTNTLVTQAEVSGVAVELLKRSLTLGPTVIRVPGEEYSGTSGGTVSIRVRAVGSARVQSTPSATITVDDITETPVSVTVAHIYKAARIAQSDLALGIKDYAIQVVEPCVESVARAIEGRLATAMNAITPGSEFAETASAADTKARIQAAMRALDEADVPQDGRYLAVSPEVRVRLLDADTGFVKASDVGSADTIKRGVFGDIYGMTVVVSNSLTTGSAIAYHKSGFALGTFPAPEGASAESAIVNNGTYALRTIRQWSPTTLSDEQVVSVFAGAAVVDANRVYRIGPYEES